MKVVLPPNKEKAFFFKKNISSILEAKNVTERWDKIIHKIMSRWHWLNSTEIQ